MFQRKQFNFALSDDGLKKLQIVQVSLENPYQNVNESSINLTQVDVNSSNKLSSIELFFLVSF